MSRLKEMCREHFHLSNKNTNQMPQQKGLIKLRGTMADINFYKTKEGYMAREKATVDKERIATDAKYARTRENMAEFGRAGKAGKVLRKAMKSITHGIS